MLRRTPRAGGRKTPLKTICLSTHSAGRRLNLIPRLIAAVRVLLNGIETIGLLGVPKGSPADVNFAVEVFQDAESALTGNSETTGTESNDAN
jgi:hypothetical protein